jgi:hypothetical protein
MRCRIGYRTGGEEGEEGERFVTGNQKTESNVDNNKYK